LLLSRQQPAQLGPLDGSEFELVVTTLQGRGEGGDLEITALEIAIAVRDRAAQLGDERSRVLGLRLGVRISNPEVRIGNSRAAIGIGLLTIDPWVGWSVGVADRVVGWPVDRVADRGRCDHPPHRRLHPGQAATPQARAYRLT
jgi:hypothetical protein